MPTTTSSTPEVTTEVTTKWECDDHLAASGEHIQDCTATVNVRDMGNAKYVEVKAIDGISYATKVITIPHAGPNLKGMVYLRNGPDSELVYWDMVVVTAMLESGETVVLERHEFSCEDVDYADACNQSTEETDDV